MFDAESWKASWLHPELIAVLEDPSLLEPIVPGVYAFPVFTDEFCSCLMEEFAAIEQNPTFQQLPEGQKRPNSMNNHGVILNAVGFQAHFDRFVSEVIAPLARALFQTDGKTLDSHHTFTVQYGDGANQDRSLAMHEDDSNITLNVNINDSFQVLPAANEHLLDRHCHLQGCMLNFCGLRDGQPQHRKLQLEYAHRKGWGVMHLGKHRHGAADIQTGDRTNLVVWARSSARRMLHPLWANELPIGANPDQICVRGDDANVEGWV